MLHSKLNYFNIAFEFILIILNIKKLFIYMLSGDVLLTHGVVYQEKKRFLAEMI